MYRLLYCSSAVQSMSDGDLTELVAVSRAHNAAVGITGMLLYLDGNFIQVLEGNRAEVTRLYGKIQSDPRHLGIMTLVQGDVTKRAFADWSMGFRCFSGHDDCVDKVFDLTEAGLAKRLPSDVPIDIGRLMSSFFTVNGRGLGH